MQECFKKYPEIYGAELADDDEDAAPEGDAAAAPLADAAQESSTPAELPAESVAPKEEEEERIVVQPKKAEDATGVNVEEKQVVPKEVEPKAEKAVQA